MQKLHAKSFKRNEKRERELRKKGYLEALNEGKDAKKGDWVEATLLWRGWTVSAMLSFLFSDVAMEAVSSLQVHVYGRHTGFEGVLNRAN